MKKLRSVKENQEPCTGVPQPFFPWKSPQNNFSYPEHTLLTKSFTGHKKLVVENTIQLLPSKFICKEMLYIESNSVITS
jgi:hypothetical protein